MEKEMSPEEINKRLELIKENCIFCKIIKKKLDSKIVFEDDLCIAILDINPTTRGHLLLMPKEHYMMMPMVPNEILGHISIISKYLSDLLIKAFNPKDVTIYIANGAAAGQQSQHFMVHIIPRYEGDGLDLDINFKGSENENKLTKNELEQLVLKLKKAIENYN